MGYTCHGVATIRMRIKLSWIKAKRARYLHIKSHSVFFDVVSEHLSLCLVRLHSPRCAYDLLPLSRSMKLLYMNRKEHAAPDRSIHVLRAPFQAFMDSELVIAVGAAPLVGQWDFAPA